MDNLKAIVAVCDDWGIGANGDMVVSNRADMRHFVSCTKGQYRHYGPQDARELSRCASTQKIVAISF